MASKVDRPVVLVVLDGWGHRESTDGNAIAMAHTPTWDRLWARAPRTLLDASGRAVGLPDGQMGNSEVGHLNLGAGRVVMQDLVRIGEAIRDGSFFQNDAFRAACAHVRTSGGTLHLMGLVGDGTRARIRAAGTSCRTLPYGSMVSVTMPSRSPMILPVMVDPSSSVSVVNAYWSLTTLLGSRIAVMKSARENRLPAAVMSGPIDSPASAKRWHWRHMPASSTRRPLPRLRGVVASARCA